MPNEKPLLNKIDVTTVELIEELTMRVFKRYDVLCEQEICAMETFVWSYLHGEAPSQEEIKRDRESEINANLG